MKNWILKICDIGYIYIMNLCHTRKWADVNKNLPAISRDTTIGSSSTKNSPAQRPSRNQLTGVRRGCRSKLASSWADGRGDRSAGRCSGHRPQQRGVHHGSTSCSRISSTGHAASSWCRLGGGQHRARGPANSRRGPDDRVSWKRAQGRGLEPTERCSGDGAGRDSGRRYRYAACGSDSQHHPYLFSHVLSKENLQFIASPTFEIRSKLKNKII